MQDGRDDLAVAEIHLATITFYVKTLSWCCISGKFTRICLTLTGFINCFVGKIDHLAKLVKKERYDKLSHLKIQLLMRLGQHAFAKPGC